MNTSSTPGTPELWLTFAREAVADLGVYKAMWDGRAERPTAAQRTAANEAVDRIDSALKNLHLLRSALVTEIRQADDASAARTDALLARLRAERDGAES